MKESIIYVHSHLSNYTCAVPKSGVVHPHSPSPLRTSVCMHKNIHTVRLVYLKYEVHIICHYFLPSRPRDSLKFHPTFLGQPWLAGSVKNETKNVGKLHITWARKGRNKADLR